MVRWTAVPAHGLGGLDVMFYKVQYRRVGGRRKSRGWETVDEDIAGNKLAIRVSRLRPGQLTVILEPQWKYLCSKNHLCETLWNNKWKLLQKAASLLPSTE